MTEFVIITLIICITVIIVRVLYLIQDKFMEKKELQEALRMTVRELESLKRQSDTRRYEFLDLLNLLSKRVLLCEVKCNIKSSEEIE